MPPVGRARLRRRLVIADATAIAVTWAVVHLLVPSTEVSWLTAIGELVAVTAATLAALAAQRLYQSRVTNVRADETARLGRVALLSAASAVVIGRLIGHDHSGLAVLSWATAIFIVLVYLRGRFSDWLRSERSKGRYTRPVLVLGHGEEARSLVSLLLECPEVGFSPIGIVGHPNGSSDMLGVPRLGSSTQIVELVHHTGVTGVIIASSSLEARQLNQVVRELHRAHIHVHLSSGISGVHRRRMRVQPIAHEPLIYIEPMRLSGAQRCAKRGLDVVAATTLLIVFAPVFAIAAAAIKLTDRGPILFRQERVGLDGRRFMLAKLRSMEVGAEGQLDAIIDLNHRDGPLFKLEDDPRVTRVGRFLRASSIDEIPQLVHVIRGTMSMVGPRPALPCEVAEFDAELLDRLRVKPGLTGLWQVEGREKASFDAYRRLDLFYVENWSVGLDLAILTGTVHSVLARIPRAMRSRPSPSLGPILVRETPPILVGETPPILVTEAAE